MQDQVESMIKPRKWYNNDIFPLVPVITMKKADKYNTASFQFRWLFFTFWTLDSFSFEISFNIDDHWGIGFTGILPYLRWVVAIPCPPKVASWVQQKLWRHSTAEKNPCDSI